MLINVVLVIVAIIVLAIIGVGVHELGHLVCGWLTGYKFGLFRIGSLAWFKENGKIKFKISKNSMAGQCTMIPVENEDDFKFILMLLGGGIFNFLAIIILLIIWHYLPDDHLLRGVMLVGIIHNLYLGISNLYPNKSWINDGAILASALKSNDAKRGLYLAFHLNGEFLKGKRYSDFKTDLFCLSPEADLTNFSIADIVLYEAQYWEDLGQYEKALAKYTSLDLEQLPSYYKNLIHLALLYIYSACIPSHEKAQAIYQDKEFQKYLKLNLPEFKRILSAYEFFVTGNYNKATELINQAKKDGENIPNHGELLMELDYINRLEVKMSEMKV